MRIKAAEIMRKTQKQRITELIRDRYSCEAEYLWAKYPEYSVFRHPISGKWFAAVMNISPDKIGLKGEENIDIIDVKCDPLMIGSLLKEKGFFPAYHMNKNSWITVTLDDKADDEHISYLIDMSYDAVSPKIKRKTPPKEKR